MEPDQAIGPKCNWRYLHELDEKRRVQVPSKWRPAEEGVELTLVLWPKAKEGPCLRAMYPQQVDALMKQLDAMPNSDSNKGVLKRVIGSESIQVTLDKSGRICIPEELARAADIGKQAMLVGLMDKFEIWNPERYEKVRASDTVKIQEAFNLME